MNLLVHVCLLLGWYFGHLIRLALIFYERHLDRRRLAAGVTTTRSGAPVAPQSLLAKLVEAKRVEVRAEATNATLSSGFARHNSD